MTPVRRFPWSLALLFAAIGLGSLYGDALRTGFLNDDYLFLEEARSHPVTESLTRLGALGNYYRPLSRQLYFAALTPLSGGSPLVFHLVNAALFAVALALLADLLRVFLPASAGDAWPGRRRSGRARRRVRGRSRPNVTAGGHLTGLTRPAVAEGSWAAQLSSTW